MSFSVIHVNVDIPGLLSLKGRVAMRFTAETRGCLKFAKFHPFLHERVDVLTDVPRTDDFLRTKISWMHRLPHDSRARELRQKRPS